MILEYTCENYKSIKEKVNFSMLASKDSSFKSLLIPFGDYMINKIAAIYGANGSGKTSCITSLGMLKYLVCNSNNAQPGDEIRRFPHKLSLPEEPTNYTIQFVKKDIRYAYGVSYTENSVLSEYLYYFPNGKQAKIFDRELETITFGDKFKKDFEPLNNFLKPNKLFLSVSANYSRVKEVEDVFLFFKEDIVFYQNTKESNNWLEYSIERLTKDSDLKKLFVTFMNSIDCPIKDINTKFETTKITPEMFPKDMPQALKSLIVQSENQEARIIEANLDYGDFSVELREESQGIQKMFEIFCPIIDIILNDKVMIWDEIETSLHPSIVNEILRLVLKGKEDSKAQLIFSTHDTNLLDLNYFRRDQIWFTQLKENRSTDLYSLAELKNVRKDENINKGYFSGKYGALPFIHNPLKFPIQEESTKN